MVQLHPLLRRVFGTSVPFSSSDELINYIIILTMFVPFTQYHDGHLKRLDNHSQYSVEQIGSDCTRIDLRGSVFLKFSGGACHPLGYL